MSETLIKPSELYRVAVFSAVTHRSSRVFPTRVEFFLSFPMFLVVEVYELNCCPKIVRKFIVKDGKNTFKLKILLISCSGYVLVGLQTKTKTKKNGQIFGNQDQNWNRNE